jgi:N utilization substance protein A
VSKEIFEALYMLEKEKGIPADYMFEKIKKAIITACKNNFDGNDEVTVDINEKTSNFSVKLIKTVCQEVKNKGKEISLEEARKINPNTAIGEQITVELETKNFGRIAAQTARNIICQGIKDSEKSLIAQEFQSKKYEIVSALIEKIDEKNGTLTLRIGKAESILPKSEQIGNEVPNEGSSIKVYVSDVKETERGPKIMVSRTHADFVRKLFENEVPEINAKVVTIKAIARESGSRTKLAVCSNDENVDAIGACIGNHGSRINVIVEELGGEKIDIIEYNQEPEKFISSALSPAEIVKVSIPDPQAKACTVVAPDHQLSLAIGNRGQNVRLAARLTGYKIDIKPESGFYNEN